MNFLLWLSIILGASFVIMVFLMVSMIRTRNMEKEENKNKEIVEMLKKSRGSKKSQKEAKSHALDELMARNLSKSSMISGIIRSAMGIKDDAPVKDITGRNIREEKKTFTQELESRFEPYGFFDRKKKGFRRSKKDLKLRYNRPESVVLIRMQMSNGTEREFLTIEQEKGFSIGKKFQYVFDTTTKRYNVDSDIWVYNFHEKISISLKFEVDINEVEHLIKKKHTTEVYASLNPRSLKQYLDADVIRQALASTALATLFKVMLILVIVGVVFLLILIIINLWGFGVFDKIFSKFNGGG